MPDDHHRQPQCTALYAGWSSPSDSQMRAKESYIQLCTALFILLLLWKPDHDQKIWKYTPLTWDNQREEGANSYSGLYPYEVHPVAWRIREKLFYKYTRYRNYQFSVFLRWI
jgi:hypothetical protein